MPFFVVYKSNIDGTNEIEIGTVRCRSEESAYDTALKKYPKNDNEILTVVPGIFSYDKTDKVHLRQEVNYRGIKTIKAACLGHLDSMCRNPIVNKDIDMVTCAKCREIYRQREITNYFA
jgi:hypothetical protein